MAEPSTTTAVAAAAAGVTVAGMLPGIDGGALIGGFAGAALFVISRSDGSVWTRIVYGLISWLIGYLAAPDVVALTPIKETAIAGFGAAAVAVTVALTAIERIKSFDFGAFISSLWKRGG